MRILYTLALLLWLGNAQAAPPCVPGLYGTQWPGSVVQPPTRFNAGWGGWGWCKKPGVNHPVIVYGLCVHGECPASIGQAIGDAVQQVGLQLLSGDAATAYSAWFDAHPPTWECGTATAYRGTPHGNLCDEVIPKMKVQLASFWPAPDPSPAPPPAPVYTHKVKPNSTAESRPVYPFAAGMRGTTPLDNPDGTPMRARILTDGKPTPCDPKVAQSPSGTSTSDVYAAYAPAFAASAVTLCTKVAP